MSERNVLPLSPRPLHYALTVTPNFADFTFKGHVEVALHADAPTKMVTLNANGLTFTRVVVAGVEVPSGKISLDTENERASFELAAEVTGDFSVVIDYAGGILESMKGFYRSKYTLRGEVTYMGTTQFEPVDARRALPCWDEPVHKATFDVTLIVPKGLMALSNMPVRKSTEQGDLAVVEFDRTPKMSTYLLAWTIGEFEYIEQTIPKSRGGSTIVRVYASEGKIKQGTFALEVACKVLPMYEEFFGSDYLLPKVDLLAIPDFSAGAMENWGLITYRETALLCDDSSSASHRHWVALVVAHELAHQWFGNLVTMDWWKELWLNESFATWVEYWAVDQLHPEWQVFTQFVNDECGRAFELDALRSSHPIEVELRNAHEVDEIFDAISYSKGGSVLRMAVEFIGMDAFRTGLREYLEHFKFRNATTADLWHFLGKAAGKDLAGILSNWVQKQGYPLLTVRTAPGGLEITQNRFLSTGKASAEDDTTLWQVPLLIQTPGSSDFTRAVLGHKTSRVPVRSSSWVKVNAKQAAFCRVLYDGSMLEQLATAVKDKAISNVDRLGLVSDYQAFAIGAFSDTVAALKLLGAYADEDDFTVWCAVAGFEAKVGGIVRGLGDAASAAHKAFAAKLYAPALQRIGIAPTPSEDSRISQLRALLLGRLVAVEHAATIEACLALFDHRETVPIPADLRGAVYGATVAKRGAAGLAAVKAILETTSDSMERARALRAMAAAPTVDLLVPCVDYVLSDSVRAQDALYFMMTLPSNPIAETLYVDTLINRWTTLFAKFQGFLIGRIVKGIEAFADEATAQRLEAFWPSLPAKEREGLDRTLRQGTEGLRINAAWAKRDGSAVAAFLSSG